MEKLTVVKNISDAGTVEKYFQIEYMRGNIYNVVVFLVVSLIPLVQRLLIYTQQVFLVGPCGAFAQQDFSLATGHLIGY